MLLKSIVKWLITPALMLSFSGPGFADVKNSDTLKPTIKVKSADLTPHKVKRQSGQKMKIVKTSPQTRHIAKAKAKPAKKVKKHIKKRHRVKAKKQKVRQKRKSAIKDVENL